MTGSAKSPPFNRVTVLFGLLFFVAGCFLFSLFSKQVLDHQQYAEAAAAQSTSTTAQPAPRGNIYATDKTGKLYDLAEDEWQYQLEISPRDVSNKPALLTKLASFLPQMNKGQVLAKINNNKVYVPPVVTGIDAATAGKITALNLAGVSLEPKLVRVYPDGPDIAPQVLGFVSANGHGQYGVEQYYDAELQGKSGSQTNEQNSLGQLISVLGTSQPQSGSDLVMSLDYNLQFYVEQQLKVAIQKYEADSGSVVILNPHTGAILAMAGEPDFDPNNYADIPSNGLSVYQAPAIADTYEPGSVFKPLNMSAALDLNVVTPDETHDAGGSVTVDGNTITNALNKDFGNETMSEILQNSDNVQMTWISSLLGATNERSYLSKFGVGQKTGVDISGEQSGSLPQLPWSDILRSTAAFGQGVSTTVLQLADDYAVFANNGVTITPHVVAKIITGNQAKAVTEPAGHQVISSQTVQEINQMLVNTVNLGEGKKAGISGVQVAGKTGTAQVASPTGGYDPTKSVGTFAGYFPANNPQFVMVVRLNNPKAVNFAESSAAPTFGLIADWMANYYGLR